MTQDYRKIFLYQKDGSFNMIQITFRILLIQKKRFLHIAIQEVFKNILKFFNNILIIIYKNTKESV